jgi:hypothetical protein
VSQAADTQIICHHLIHKHHKLISSPVLMAHSNGDYGQLGKWNGTPFFPPRQVYHLHSR